jgi:hypothetical protein
MGALARYMKMSLFVQPLPPTSGLQMVHPWAGLMEFLSQSKTIFAQNLDPLLPGTSVCVRILFIFRSQSPLISRAAPLFSQISSLVTTLPQFNGFLILVLSPLEKL